MSKCRNLSVPVDEFLQHRGQDSQSEAEFSAEHQPSDHYFADVVQIFQSPRFGQSCLAALSLRFGCS
jgi:hypothetical protein